MGNIILAPCGPCLQQLPSDKEPKLSSDISLYGINLQIPSAYDSLDCSIELKPHNTTPSVSSTQLDYTSPEPDSALPDIDSTKISRISLIEESSACNSDNNDAVESPSHYVGYHSMPQCSDVESTSEYSEQTLADPAKSEMTDVAPPSISTISYEDNELHRRFSVCASPASDSFFSEESLDVILSPSADISLRMSRYIMTDDVSGFKQYTQKNNIDIDAPIFENEGTALHFAAERGRFRIVGYLVASNADIKALNKFDRTPLYLAFLNGHDKVIEILSNAAQVYEIHEDISVNTSSSLRTDSDIKISEKRVQGKKKITKKMKEIRKMAGNIMSSMTTFTSSTKITRK